MLPQEIVNLVTKNDKVNNCSHEIHSITPHIEFEHIKRKKNVLAESLSRLRCVGLHDDNDPEEPGQEHGKSIFDAHKNTVNSIKSDQNMNNKFEIDGIKYSLDEKELANTRLHNTSANGTGTNSLPCTCNLDPEKIKWLQQQDEYLTKLIDE